MAQNYSPLSGAVNPSLIDLIRQVFGDEAARDELFQVMGDTTSAMADVPIGLGAAALGGVMDLASMGYGQDPMMMANAPMPPTTGWEGQQMPPPQEIPGGTDWWGERLGSDTTAPLFLAGSVLGFGGKRRAAEEGAEALFDLSRLGREEKSLRRPIDYYTPPRGTPQRMTRLAENDDAYQQVLQWAKRGLGEEGLGWYDTAPLRDAFIKEYGQEEGMRRMGLFMDMVASTSTGAKVPQNIKTASHYYQQAIQGGMDPSALSIPLKGSGYGHKMQKNHFAGALEVLGGGGLDPKVRPKRRTFSENLQGNWSESTVDKHNVRAWGIASKDPDFVKTSISAKELDKLPRPEFWDDSRFGSWPPKKLQPQKFIKEHNVDWEEIPVMWFKEAPSNTEYRAYNDLNKRLAEDLGITPAQAQAALWIGAGERTGLGSPPKAFMQLFEERVMRTAEELGIEPMDALRKFMAGDERLRAVIIPAMLAGGAGFGLTGEPDDGQF